MSNTTLVDSIASMLRRYNILTPIQVTGDGDMNGGTFQIFGRGPANRQLILDVFLRILVASEDFANPVHCSRTYKLVRQHDTPQLAQGYTIAGICEGSEEVTRILDAVDISEWTRETGTEEVTEAKFFVSAGDGKNVRPSGRRNIPRTDADTPDGTKGVWEVKGTKRRGRA